MTREEAIKIINCYDIGFYDLSGEKIPADKLVDAFDMAIEALKERAMTREEATQELVEWIKQMKDHGVPPYSAKYKALKLAIEALQAETKHGKWVLGDGYYCSSCGYNL